MAYQSKYSTGTISILAGSRLINADVGGAVENWISPTVGIGDKFSIDGIIWYTIVSVAPTQLLLESDYPVDVTSSTYFITGSVTIDEAFEELSGEFGDTTLLIGGKDLVGSLIQGFNTAAIEGASTRFESWA